MLDRDQVSPLNNPATTRPPILLFSGLAANAEVFVAQRAALPQLQVIAWKTPLANESLQAYALRIADDLRSYQPMMLGGASFGGIVALHVAEILKPSSVVLIGSVRNPHKLPRFIKLLRPLSFLVALIPVRILQLVVNIILKMGMLPKRWKHLTGIARQFIQSDPVVFKWSLKQLLTWQRTPKIDCPIYQIHGERDRVLPLSHDEPVTVIAQGGHVISLTHANQVTEFLRKIYEREFPSS